jgi:hypothetical protein
MPAVFTCTCIGEPTVHHVINKKYRGDALSEKKDIDQDTAPRDISVTRLRPVSGLAGLGVSSSHELENSQ